MNLVTREEESCVCGVMGYTPRVWHSLSGHSRERQEEALQEPRNLSSWETSCLTNEHLVTPSVVVLL